MKKKNLTIGIISEDIGECCQATIRQGIKDSCLRAGINLITFAGEFRLEYYQQEMHYMLFEDFAGKSNIDGLLMLTGSFIQFYDEHTRQNVLNNIKPIPIVSIGITLGDMPGVIIDNRKGMFDIVSHLITVHQKKKIAFVKGPEKHHETHERYAGYLTALKEHTIAYNADLVIPGDYSEEWGVNAARILLDERKCDFDAVVGSDDTIAAGVIKALSERGVKVPADVAVVGFDRLPDTTVPEILTTVDQHFYRQGQKAVELLLDIINGTPVQQQVMIPTDLILNGSCGCRKDEAGNNRDNIQAHDDQDGTGKLHRLSRVMLTTFTGLDMILDLLYKELSLLNIKTCYIALYETEKGKIKIKDSILPKKSDLIFAFHDGKKIIRDTKNIFTTRELLPRKIITKLSKYNLIFYPLSFQEEHYGYIIFESAINEQPAIYNTLRIYMSSFIKGYILLKELQESNFRKNNYFTNLAHETKTPLTLIDNYLQKEIDERGMNKNLAVIKHNTEKLKNDIVNYLDFEKLEKNLMRYDHNLIINLSAMIKEKCAMFTVPAAKQSVQIKTAIDEDIYIAADPAAIDRIINNLLDNALKYNRQGGFVTVEVTKKKSSKVMCKTVICKIENTGPGIPADLLGNIFTPYYQIVRQKRNIQGIGMGLAIVKKIVDDMQAGITVSSVENGLTCFTLTLQRQVPPENVTPVMDYTVEKPPYSNAAPRLLPEEYHKGKPVLFIIEDNLQMISFLQNGFIREYNVYYALNGKEALSKIRWIPVPDLIITDVMMDEMDGYELCRQLKTDEHLRAVPIIFLTAKRTKPDKLKALNLGAVDFISKPFAFDEIKIKIAALIKQKKEQQHANRRSFEKKISRLLTSEPEYDYQFFMDTYNNIKKDYDIVELLIQGFEYKEIAAKLNISISTVKRRIHGIYKQCGVSNKVELLNLIR